MLMKRLLMTLGLLVAASALAADTVTVKLDDVQPYGAHTNIWFQCKFTIHNATSTSFFTTNLFIGPPGLALRISDLGGKELRRVYANGWIYYATNNPTIAPGDNTFKEPYGLGGRYSDPFPLPEIVRVQLEGTLSWSGYTNHLTSNVVEVHVP